MFYRVAYYIQDRIFRIWLVNAFEIGNFYIAPSRNFLSGNKQTNKQTNKQKINTTKSIQKKIATFSNLWKCWSYVRRGRTRSRKNTNCEKCNATNTRIIRVFMWNYTRLRLVQFQETFKTSLALIKITKCTWYYAYFYLPQVGSL